jgi:uncharacterized membrane protein YoaK (UPF0700 family)
LWSAWVLLGYGVIEGSLELSHALQAGFSFALIAHCCFAARVGKFRSIKEKSPKLSGTLVVVLTGFAAVASLSRERADTWIIIFAAILTGITALLVYRFARKHGKDIGEVRIKADQNNR